MEQNDNSKSLLNTARRYFMEGRIREALQELDDQYQSNPSPESLYQLIDAALKHGTYSDVDWASDRIRHYLNSISGEYNRELFAKALEVANWRSSEILFHELCKRIDDSDLYSDTRIVYQLYRFLAKKERYEKLLNHYEKVDESVRRNSAIRRYVTRAKNALYGQEQDGIDDFGKTDRRPLFLLGKFQNQYALARVLNSEGICTEDVFQSTKPGDGLLRNYMRRATRKDWVVILLLPELSDSLGRWYPHPDLTFACGSLLSKLDPKQICLLYDTDGKDFILPGDLDKRNKICLKDSNWKENFCSFLRDFRAEAEQL